LAGLAQSGFADNFMPTDPTMDMGALEQYAAQNPIPQQTPLSDYSAMDWLGGGKDMVADALSAWVREPASVARRTAEREAYMDYQPRTELGARLSEAGEEGFVDMIGAAMKYGTPWWIRTPSPELQQRMLDAYMGKANELAPREMQALGGLYKFSDIF
jgi:hypothetical protein